jgi:hypothetical protein
MSDALGLVQQVVLAMLDAEPGRAWTTDEICRRVYPKEKTIEQKHRVAVYRGIRRTPPNGTAWRFKTANVKEYKYCLYDPYNDDSSVHCEYLCHRSSRKLKYRDWKEKYPRAVAMALAAASKAREYRGAPPLRRLILDVDRGEEISPDGLGPTR